MRVVERVRDASTVLQLVIGALALALIVGAGYGLWRGLRGNDDPPPEETVRVSVIDRYAQQLGRMADARDSALQVARSADSALAETQDSLEVVQRRARSERERADSAVQVTGDSLEVVLGRLQEAVRPALRPVVQRARVLTDSVEAQYERQVATLQWQVSWEQRAKRKATQARDRWRSLYRQTDSALAVAEARADSLAASRDYWRGEARTSFTERLASGYSQAAGKIAAVGIACYPETGSTEACIGAAGMWAVDAALEGLP